MKRIGMLKYDDMREAVLGHCVKMPLYELDCRNISIVA